MFRLSLLIAITASLSTLVAFASDWEEDPPAPSSSNEVQGPFRNPIVGDDGLVPFSPLDQFTRQTENQFGGSSGDALAPAGPLGNAPIANPATPGLPPKSSGQT